MQFFIASSLRRAGRGQTDSELDQRSVALDGGGSGSCVEIKLTTAETGLTSQSE